MISFWVEEHGGKRMRDSMGRFVSNKPALAKLGQFLEREMEEVIRESQRLVPIDTGALHDSASVAPYRIVPGNKVEVAFGYNIWYAEYVHEDLLMNHPNGGQAKFLEEPYNEWKATRRSAVKAAVREAFR